MFNDIMQKYLSLSLRKQGCKSTSYVIYTLYYTQKFRCLKNLSHFFCCNIRLYS